MKTLKDFVTINELNVAKEVLEQLRKIKFTGSSLITVPKGISLWYSVKEVDRYAEVYFVAEDSDLIVRGSIYIGDKPKLPQLDRFELQYKVDTTISTIIIDMLDELKR